MCHYKEKHENFLTDNGTVLYAVGSGLCISIHAKFIKLHTKKSKFYGIH